MRPTFHFSTLLSYLIDINNICSQCLLIQNSDSSIFVRSCLMLQWDNVWGILAALTGEDTIRQIHFLYDLFEGLRICSMRIQNGFIEEGNFSLASVVLSLSGPEADCCRYELPSSVVRLFLCLQFHSKVTFTSLVRQSPSLG